MSCVGYSSWIAEAFAVAAEAILGKDAVKGVVERVSGAAGDIGGGDLERCLSG